ncbi:MAG: XdhC family protein [Cryobacterium sp.]|nr:XdhC family protein [Oligoflexia bacterium]
MNESSAILEFYRSASREGTPVALATVVRVDGSSYRRPGAKMLIARDGRINGSVSGGCLERDLIRRAVLALDQNQSSLIRYDTRADADDDEAEALVKSAGLGCEGVIEIFLDPNPALHLSAIERVIRSDVGEDFYVDVPNQAPFIDRIEPPHRLILFGAGHDAVSMWRLARELGWLTTVVDLRSSFPVPKSLFSGVDRYLVPDLVEAVEKAQVGPHSLVILMTHQFEHDRALLSALSENPPLYVGMLGPRVRSEKILNSLRGQGNGVAFPNLHSPLGLDIGGDTPAAVALSALAEIQAVLSHRSAGFLSARKVPIHSPEGGPGEKDEVSTSRLTLGGVER